MCVRNRDGALITDARFQASETATSCIYTKHGLERTHVRTYNARADRVNATTHDACICHAINNAPPPRTDRMDDQSGVGVEKSENGGTEGGREREGRDTERVCALQKKGREREKEQSRTTYVTTALRRRILLRILKFLRRETLRERCRVYR